MRWILIGLLATTGHLRAATRVEVANPSDFARNGETIEVPWKQPGPVIVRDAKSRQEIVSQILSNTLIFQADFASRQSRTFLIAPGKAKLAEPRVFARLVPERYDDFAWENDRIAFRVYGPEFENHHKYSTSGVDVWCKSVSKLIINDWYRRDDYHKDHGEGLDCYKVGPGTGCGGVAIWKDGQPQSSRVFRQCRVLANGPLRAVFELTYDGQTKLVTLDAGSHFNRLESVFDSDTEVGVGLTLHQQAEIASTNGWIAVWDLADQPDGNDHGMIGTGAVNLNGEFRRTETETWLVTRVQKGVPFIYYAGAGWSKAGFDSAKAWQQHVSEFARRVREPLRVKIK